MGIFSSSLRVFVEPVKPVKLASETNQEASWLHRMRGSPLSLRGGIRLPLREKSVSAPFGTGPAPGLRHLRGTLDRSVLPVRVPHTGHPLRLHPRRRRHGPRAPLLPWRPVPKPDPGVIHWYNNAVTHSPPPPPREVFTSPKVVRGRGRFSGGAVRPRLSRAFAYQSPPGSCQVTTSHHFGAIPFASTGCRSRPHPFYRSFSFRVSYRWTGILKGSFKYRKKRIRYTSPGIALNCNWVPMRDFCAKEFPQFRS